jgi:branched-chain amino acid transport system permease protein
MLPRNLIGNWSKQEKASRLLKWIALIIVLSWIPSLTNNYSQYVVNMIFIYILLTFGLNVILGYCGQFAFCQIAFYGIGAYTCAYLTNKVGVPFWVSLPFGGLTGAFAAFLLSFIARKLERYWLAIITMSFTEIMVWVFEHWSAVTDGVNGMVVKRPSLFGFNFNTDHKVYYVNAIICLIMMYGGWRLISSKYGRAFVAVREGELVAQCFGISPSRTKVIAYAVSGFYAGIAGSLLGLNLGLIVPSTFNNAQGGILFGMVMIGGLGTYMGSIGGAALLVLLPEALRESQAYQEMAYGFLLLLILIFLPKGLDGLMRRIPFLPKEKLRIT